MARFTWKRGLVLHGKFVAAAVCILLAITLASCKRNESGSGSESSAGKSAQVEAGEGISLDGGNSYAHVTYKPEVKVLEASQVDSSLQGISSDGHALVFKNADAQIRALKAGDLLFIKNQLVRKVLAAQTDGDQTVLFTDAATITDVVQDGDIQIDAPLRFHASRKTAETRPYGHSIMDLFGGPVYAQGILPCWAPDSAVAGSVKSVVGSMVSGWTITKWSVKSGDSELDFNLVMTKKTQGFVAMVSMSGFVTNFDFVSNISVVKGAGRKMFTGVKKMTGKIQFDWEIGKDSPGVWAVEDRIKLPAGITIPLGGFLGGMPLSLDISSALLIHPALTGGGEYSKGGFAITWTGGANFSSQAGATPNGDSNIQMTFQVIQDTNISPIAPNGMVISYCAPRLELKLDAFGKYANSLCNFAAGIVGIDHIAAAAAALLPSSVTEAMSQSPLSKVTASSILSSKADVFVQFVTTEGVTHSSNQTPAPCSKQEIKLLAQGGGDAQLLGLTKGATKTADLFTKTFYRWDPASDFCKKI